MKFALLGLVIAISSVGLFAQKIKYEFIAMQYVGLSNRSFVVQVSDSLIFGGKVRGVIAAGASRFNSKEVLADPYFYAKTDLLELYHVDSFIHKELLSKNNANFLIAKNDIKSVTYTSKKKWGMGDIVHTGRVFIELKSGEKIELILLGRPDVQAICDAIGANVVE